MTDLVAQQSESLNRSSDALLERVVIKGDLSALTNAERVGYYMQVCKSLGLNPITKPFDYLTLEEKSKNDQTGRWEVISSKLVLYPNTQCAAQLRDLRRINLTIKSREVVEGCYVVTIAARAPGGRMDEATGIAALEDNFGKPLKGKARANAMMKAETVAKRRVTLSICGLNLSADADEDNTMSAEAFDPPLDAIDLSQINGYQDAEVVDSIADARRKELMDAIASETSDRLKWSKRQASNFLMQKYGKQTRSQLTDEELMDCAGQLMNIQPIVDDLADADQDGEGDRAHPSTIGE